ncbi:MAG: hypothetical protein IT454_04710 [Planctomycetes bacterium]|nr:hypothetical protein [Planctomycetota bacterium]
MSLIDSLLRRLRGEGRTRRCAREELTVRSLRAWGASAGRLRFALCALVLQDRVPTLGVLAGRALEHGAPATSARVRVWERALEDPVQRWDNTLFPDAFGWSFDARSPTVHLGRPRELTVDGAGRFEIELSDRNRHLVELVTPHGASLRLDSVSLSGLSRVELGDLELVAPGALRGRVTLPSGFTTKLVSVLVWGLGRVEAERPTKLAVAPDGTFEWSAAPSGELVVLAVSAHPRTGSSVVTKVHVNTGERTQAELALELAVAQSLPALLEREIEVRLNAQVPGRVRLDLRPFDGYFSHQAQWTNEEGFVRACWSSVGRSALELSSPLGLAIGRAPFELEWSAQEPDAVAVELAAGRVRLELPREARERATSLALVDGVREELDFDARVMLSGAPAQELGWARVGWHTFVLEERAGPASAARRWRRRVPVVPGRTTTVVFRERDRVDAQW